MKAAKLATAQMSFDFELLMGGKSPIVTAGAAPQIAADDGPLTNDVLVARYVVGTAGPVPAQWLQELDELRAEAQAVYAEQKSEFKNPNDPFERLERMRNFMKFRWHFTNVVRGMDGLKPISYDEYLGPIEEDED